MIYYIHKGPIKDCRLDGHAEDVFCFSFEVFILQKYFINIDITYYLYAARSTAAVINLQFVKLIHKNKFRNNNITLKLCIISAHCPELHTVHCLFQQSKVYFCLYPVHGYWFGGWHFSDNKSDNLE